MRAHSILLVCFLGFGLAPLTVASSYAGAPIIYYPLDEGGGQVAYDSSGFGRHATTTSLSPSWQPAGGIIGGALSFEAASQSATAQAFVYNAPSPIVSSHPFTLAAWIKTSQVTNYPRACLFLAPLSPAITRCMSTKPIMRSRWRA